MSSLSDSQLTMLDNLIYYISNDIRFSFTEKDVISVGDLVAQAKAQVASYKSYHKGYYEKHPEKSGLEDLPAAMSEEEWNVLLTTIENDEQLCKYTMCNYRNDEIGSETYNFCAATFTNPENPSDINVIFRGTNGDLNEWTDNGAGGYSADTEYQREAATYIKDIYDEYEYPITVSGHSKGGNLAMYTAIMTDCVDRCVAVDGQGFSEEFIK